MKKSSQCLKRALSVRHSRDVVRCTKISQCMLLLFPVALPLRHCNCSGINKSICSKCSLISRQPSASSFPNVICFSARQIRVYTAIMVNITKLYCLVKCLGYLRISCPPNPLCRNNLASFIMTRGIAGSQVTLCGEFCPTSHWEQIISSAWR